MNIGFDAKRFFHNQTGLGNYSRSTISQLYRYFPEHKYFLFTPKPPRRSKQQSKLQIITPPGKIQQRLHPLWRSFLLGKQLARYDLDIYHGLSHELPLILPNKKIKYVLTVHDLIFMRYPKLYKPADKYLYQLKYKFSCRQADLILAISEQTRQDLIDYFKLPKEKVKIAYQSCNPIYYQNVSPETRQAIINKYSLPGEYILYVGSLSPRKNVHTLLTALSFIKPTQRPALVLVGTGSQKYTAQLAQQAHTLKLKSSLFFAGQVALQDLPAIYQQSKAFIYPSVFEGFGIPILEALYSSVPVITSTGSCFSEPGGKNSIYVNPYNARHLALAIEKVVQNQDLRQKMITKGLVHAQKFHEKNCVQQLMSYYKQLI